MALVVKSRVDPRDLRVNIRHKGSQALPKRVRDAMTNLQDDVFEEAVKTEYSPPSIAFVEVEFSFPDRRCDLDGPIKHTIDALQHGLRKAGHAWNDRSLEEIHMKRVTGNPGIKIILYGEVDFA